MLFFVSEDVVVLCQLPPACLCPAPPCVGTKGLAHGALLSFTALGTVCWWAGSGDKYTAFNGETGTWVLQANLHTLPMHTGYQRFQTIQQSWNKTLFKTYLNLVELSRLSPETLLLGSPLGLGPYFVKMLKLSSWSGYLSPWFNRSSIVCQGWKDSKSALVWEMNLKIKKTRWRK